MAKTPKISLPKTCSAHVKSAMLHIISLAQFATAYTRGWAAIHLQLLLQVILPKRLGQTLVQKKTRPHRASTPSSLARPCPRQPGRRQKVRELQLLTHRTFVQTLRFRVPSGLRFRRRL